jgi:hypothetical protein
MLSRRNFLSTTAGATAGIAVMADLSVATLPAASTLVEHPLLLSNNKMFDFMETTRQAHGKLAKFVDNKGKIKFTRNLDLSSEQNRLRFARNLVKAINEFEKSENPNSKINLNPLDLKELQASMDAAKKVLNSFTPAEKELEVDREMWNEREIGGNFFPGFGHKHFAVHDLVSKVGEKKAATQIFDRISRQIDAYQKCGQTTARELQALAQSLDAYKTGISPHLSRWIKLISDGKLNDVKSDPCFRNFVDFCEQNDFLAERYFMDARNTSQKKQISFDNSDPFFGDDFIFRGRKAFPQSVFFNVEGNSTYSADLQQKECDILADPLYRKAFLMNPKNDSLLKGLAAQYNHLRKLADDLAEAGLDSAELALMDMPSHQHAKARPFLSLMQSIQAYIGEAQPGTSLPTHLNQELSSRFFEAASAIQNSSKTLWKTKSSLLRLELIRAGRFLETGLS